MKTGEQHGMIIGSDFTVFIIVVERVVVVGLLSFGSMTRFDDSRRPFSSIETKIENKESEIYELGIREEINNGKVDLIKLKMNENRHRSTPE